MTTEDHKDYILTYDDSAEAKERVYQIMLAFFKKIEAFHPDSIGGGNDEVYIQAPDLMCKVATKGFKFKAKWKE